MKTLYRFLVVILFFLGCSDETAVMDEIVEAPVPELELSYVSEPIYDCVVIGKFRYNGDNFSTFRVCKTADDSPLDYDLIFFIPPLEGVYYHYEWHLPPLVDDGMLNLEKAVKVEAYE